MTTPRLALAVTAVALGLAAGCLSLENKLVFRPTRHTAEETVLLEPPVRDVTLQTADGTPIHARWCPRVGSAGAVLFCHGNGGDLESRARPVYELGAALGESVLIFDYPGYGRSGGTPGEAYCYAAADAAYDWLTREQGVPPGRVLVFGESLGGAVAIDLASRRPHRALVVVKTFASLPDVIADQLPLLPVRWLVTNSFDNMAKIGRCGGPVLIAGAECDRLVPFEHASRLAKAAGPAAQFVVLKGAGHNDPLAPGFYAALREFVDREAPLGGGERAELAGPAR